MKIAFSCRSALLPLLAFFSFSAAASAATLAISAGGPGVAGMRLSDRLGLPSESGGYLIMAGTFAADPFESGASQWTEVLASFQEFGRTTSPTRGFSKNQVAGAITAFDPTRTLGGKQIYFVLGNEPTLEQSTSFVVLKSPDNLWCFPEELDVATAYVVVLGKNTPISVLGGFVESVPGEDEANVIHATGWLPAPEPGVCMLGLLGTMSVFARRRR